MLLSIRRCEDSHLLTETWIERAEQVLNDSSSVFLTDEDLLDEINEWLDEKYPV